MRFPIQSTPSVLPGLDTLLEQCENAAEVLPLLRGRRVGLLTNHTGRTRQGASTLATLRALNLNVHAFFSPEHGIEGKAEGHIASSQTEDQLPIYSLYGATRRPTTAMLNEIDVLVCDLQDVGARFYTYASTLANCMEVCAAHAIPVVVLDRPNPIGGEIIEGPALDKNAHSFVGYLDVPIRHGLTLGELALLFQSDAQLKMELHIARMHNWKRDMLWPQTGLEWPVPSPNLPDFQSALWYPGTCLLEFSKISVGRGTPAPFQIIGAPWIDATRVLQTLEQEPIFANEFQAETISFTPTRGQCEGLHCSGLKLSTRHAALSTQKFVPLGLLLLSTLHRVQPQEFDDKKLQAALRLLGAAGVLQRLREGEVRAAVEVAERDAETFRKRRKPFLLYV